MYLCISCSYKNTYHPFPFPSTLKLPAEEMQQWNNKPAPFAATPNTLCRLIKCKAGKNKKNAIRILVLWDEGNVQKKGERDKMELVVAS